MLPIIALVGRPNVGKSTLFNRLTKTRDAIVANFPGLTRDRKYGDINVDGNCAILIDTGGLSSDDAGIDAVMADQSLQAIEEADIVFFMVDAREGISADDKVIANHLRKENKKVELIANKIDGLDPEIAIAPFYELGLGRIHSLAASQGRGVNKLVTYVLESWYRGNASEHNLAGVEKTEAAEEDKRSKSIKLALVGRPNVGKSTLANRMLGEDRVVVFDQPGTTRDSIYIDFERDGESYTIIDTAGIRRRKNVKQTVEKFSIVKTLQAIEDANVVILVVDAQEGLVDQDLHLMGHVIDKGRALVIALNKWDGLESEHKEFVKNELDRKLRFVDFADIHTISALHGTGVGNLYKSVKKAYQSATDKMSTNFLTRILGEAVKTHQPPLVNGRRIKLRYAHSGGRNPPIVVIHGNQTDSVPAHYTRYLEKTFRRALKLHGTPLRVEYKTGDNPFNKGRKQR